MPPAAAGGPGIKVATRHARARVGTRAAAKAQWIHLLKREAAVGKGVVVDAIAIRLRD
jgi:hypothetical protein